MLLFVVACANLASVKQYNDYSFHLIRKGLYKEAEFYLLKAEKENPEDYMIKNNLAIVYEALGDVSKAEKYYTQALKLTDKKTIRKNYENFKTDSSR